ncbi:site-specific integrase [Burkholderia cenocepacia]|uniref:site-specific integrase n=1 Tax=Burkholderia cenocepacia TaxID=95486 RepID=UPI00223768C4|nr:integrase family protein [Burkholderia cenocepacia]MCW5156462.1 integrase family protein [Burkholderia cenocepacia]
MADNKIVFNKSNLDKIPFAPPGEQLFYYDTKTPGFGLRVGANKKAYILYARVKHGKPVRVTLGQYGVMTVDQAREACINELNKLNSGIDPNAERKQEKAEKVLAAKKDVETLEWLINLYKTEHIEKKTKDKKGSEGTLRTIGDMMNKCKAHTVTILKETKDGVWVEDKKVELSDWLNRPYRSITKTEVLERFKIFAVSRPSRLRRDKQTGQSILQPMIRTHQIAFRMLRAAYNYQIPRAAHLNPEDVMENPFNILTVYDQWTEPNIRTNFVNFNESEFLNWWSAVANYNYYAGLVRDYLLLSLIQGGRSIDIAPMKKSQVDFKKKHIHYINTKNGNDYIFPMTRFAEEILKRRFEQNAGSDYVFAYDLSKSGHIPQSCKHHFKLIAKESGKLISHHDLRRTWATAARTKKLNIDKRDIDYCLKHIVKDVDAHYFMQEEERIHDALQKVEDFFFEQLKKLDEKVHAWRHTMPKTEAVENQVQNNKQEEAQA